MRKDTRRSFGDLLSNLQIYRTLSYRLTGHRTPYRRGAYLFLGERIKKGDRRLARLISSVQAELWIPIWKYFCTPFSCARARDPPASSSSSSPLFVVAAGPVGRAEEEKGLARGGGEGRSGRENRGHVIRESLISAPGGIMIVPRGQVSRAVHPYTPIRAGYNAACERVLMLPSPSIDALAARNLSLFVIPAPGSGPRLGHSSFLTLCATLTLCAYSLVPRLSPSRSARASAILFHI